MAGLSVDGLSLAAPSDCVASEPLKRPGLSHSSTGASLLSRTSSSASSASSVATDVDADEPTTKVSLATLLLFWAFDSSLLDTGAVVGSAPLRWTVGSVYVRCCAVWVD